MIPVADKPLDRKAPSIPFPWISTIWFAGLIALCYWPVLVRLVVQWNNDEDMGHGFFVPILAAYIAWQLRDDFLREPAQPNKWGLVLVIYAGVQLVLATLGVELFL